MLPEKVELAERIKTAFENFTAENREKNEDDIISLLSYVEDINMSIVVNPFNDTFNLLHFAVQINSERLIGYLCEKGIDKDNLSGLVGTPLQMAVFYPDHNKMVSVLLERGVDINKQDDQGFTALHMALQLGNLAIANLLLGYKPDLNLKDKDQRTARSLALNVKETLASTLTPTKIEEYEKIIARLQAAETAKIIWDMWVMESTTYDNPLQWLPREMVEDSLALINPKC